MSKRKKVRLTARGRHALTAMVEIALQNQDKPVSLSRIAAAGEISLSYLEQLFAGLRRYGLVKSFRGPGGGYILAKPVSDIPVSDILLSAEDSTPAKRGKTDEGRSAFGNQQTRAFWSRMDEIFYGCLQHISLADVIEDKLETHAFLNNLFETLD